MNISVSISISISIAIAISISLESHLPRYPTVEPIKNSVTNKLAILVIIDYKNLIKEKSPNMPLSINYIYIGHMYLLIKHTSYCSND